nr:hypothetical protein [Armatimonas sp.]
MNQTNNIAPTSADNNTTSAAPKLAITRRLEQEDVELLELWDASTPELRKVLIALVELLGNKNLQDGAPLTDTQRAQALAIVGAEVARLRADGFPCEKLEDFIGKQGGKS